MIEFGGLNIKDIRLGDTAIMLMSLGDQIIYQKPTGYDSQCVFALFNTTKGTFGCRLYDVSGYDPSLGARLFFSTDEDVTDVTDNSQFVELQAISQPSITGSSVYGDVYSQTFDCPD